MEPPPGLAGDEEDLAGGIASGLNPGLDDEDLERLGVGVGGLQFGPELGDLKLCQFARGKG